MSAHTVEDWGQHKKSLDNEHLTLDRRDVQEVQTKLTKMFTPGPVHDKLSYEAFSHKNMFWIYPCLVIQVRYHASLG